MPADIKYVTFEKLEDIQKRLLDEAVNAMEKAYNPYSNFSVGASLLSQDGQIITGSNVENAAFGPTICAERSAIVRANSMEIRQFYRAAIIAKGKDFSTSRVTAPCGPCRQMLYESSQVSGTDLEIIMATSTMDKIAITTIAELLPLGFGPNDLKVDIKKYQK